MNIKIENLSEKRIIGGILKRKVNKLIRTIPKDHLMGIDKIVIVDEIHDKKKRGLGGVYRKKEHGEACSIELSINAIFKGMPKIFFFVPFISVFSLADVLYHEIGHHYHNKFSHGINKKKEEILVEKYSLEMSKKKFKWWSYFLTPFTPLVKYLNKKVNKQTL